MPSTRKIIKNTVRERGYDPDRYDDLIRGAAQAVDDQPDRPTAEVLTEAVSRSGFGYAVPTQLIVSVATAVDAERIGANGNGSAPATASTADIIRDEATKSGLSRYATDEAVGSAASAIDQGQTVRAVLESAIRQAGGSPGSYRSFIEAVEWRMGQGANGPQDAVQPQGQAIGDFQPVAPLTVAQYANRLREIATRMGLAPYRVDQALREAGMLGEDADKPVLTVVPTIPATLGSQDQADAQGEDALTVMVREVGHDVVKGLRKAVKRLDQIRKDLREGI